MMKKQKFNQTEIGMIPEDWNVVKLGSLCDVKSGKRLRKGRVLVEYKTKHPYIRVRDLANGSVKVNELLFLDEETYREVSRYIITNDDVYISIVGTIGLVGLIPPEISGANLTENCARLTNITRSTKEWISFYLNSKSGQDQIKSLTVGTTQGKLALFRIKDINIPIASLIEQQAIAAILSSLDSKIELNQAMNKTLEAVGQAIFKHWFVDFEFPNEKGKPYKSSGGEMVESELGDVPKGWEVSSLGNEFDILMGQSPPGESYNEMGEGVIFFQGRTDFGFRYPGNRIFCTAPTRFGEKNATLLSVRAPVGDLNMVKERCCIGRGLAAIIHKSKSRSYTYYLLHTLQSQFESFDAEGTVFGSVNKNSLGNIKIIAPKKELIKIFEETIFAFDENIENNEFESGGLSEIRDSLLPKLMSGKIRVPIEVIENA